MYLYDSLGVEANVKKYCVKLRVIEPGAWLDGGEWC
jgi:hypothetical protein